MYLRMLAQNKKTPNKNIPINRFHKGRTLLKIIYFFLKYMNRFTNLNVQLLNNIILFNIVLEYSFIFKITILPKFSKFILVNFIY